MTAEALKEPGGEAFPIDAVTAVIAEHGGDAMAALRTVLEANAALELELAMTLPAVSYGFSRGWHHKRASR